VSEAVIDGAGAWTFRLALPPAWFTVGIDLPPGDRRGAITRAIDDALAATPELARIDVLMFDAAWAVAAEAVDTRALAAAVGFCRCGPDLAVMAATVHRVPAGWPADLSELAEAAAMPRPDDLSPRSVSRARLPVGPAVRVHSIALGRPSGGRPGDTAAPQAAIESVDHFVPVPATDDMLWLRCATPSVAVGYEVLGTFDAMAASLTIRNHGYRTGPRMGELA
jgi:hypothetical protein